MLIAARARRSVLVTATLTLLLAACTDASPPAADRSPDPAVVAPDVVEPAPEPDPEPTPEPSPDPPALTAVEVLATVDEPVRFVVPWEDPTDAATLAAVLSAAETAVRDAALSDDARAEAAHQAQRAYRQLGRTPAWRDDVLAALPEHQRTAATANLDARDALDALRQDAPPPTSLPAWEIVEPAPATELLQHYRDAGSEIGVDWTLLAAINLVETRMGRIVGFSTAGARGPMQFIPGSWEAFGAGGDIDDPRDAIFAAARHLTGRPGNPPSDRGALRGYNNSDHYADAVLAYASVLRADPDAYLGYHAWQVYYTTAEAEILLPVGYREPEQVPVAEYLARPAHTVTR